MQAGQHIKVREQGRAAWRDATVTLASSNGKSLAIEIEDGTLAFGVFLAGGLFIDTRSGKQAVLLSRDEGEHGAGNSPPAEWRDVASGRVIEVQE